MSPPQETSLVAAISPRRRPLFAVRKCVVAKLRCLKENRSSDIAGNQLRGRLSSMPRQLPAAINMARFGVAGKHNRRLCQRH
nr:hypothetical protein Iba_chr03bCG1540 [Ipomoea batatas]